MAKTEIRFSFAFRGDSHVAMEVNRHGVADINICVPTEEIIKLFNDCLSEWDILFPQEREDIKDIYQYIGKILKDEEAERRCMNCDDPKACVNCENFAKIHGQT